MLLGNFFTYTIIDKNDGEFQVQVFLNKNHEIYAGHFPQVPVVPGVCQVQMVKETIQEVLGVNLQLISAREIKFLSMINPNECDTFQLNVKYEIAENGIVKVASVSNDNERNYLKFKGEYLVKTNSFHSLFKEKKCCVLIPTYNNATKLAAVLDDVLDYSSDVIVVNDGSTDNTSDILKLYKQIYVVEYSKNKGKGDALKTGFKFAIEKGYDYTITLDSDGQHFAKDLPSFLSLIDENPNAILIGTRQLNQENVPGKSSFANKFSNFWFKVETGLSLDDTQSGYRLYPLHSLKNIRFFSKKYEFELEVLVRSSWKGIDIKPVAIDVFYPVKEERITHFRPFKDFFRISVLNTVLVTLALLYFRPIGIFNSYKKKSFKQILKDDVLGSNAPTHIIAKSIGFGVFMGIFPIWGYQIMVGLLLAHLLKLNKAIFFIAANVSFPPFIPFIFYLSFVTGGYALGKGTWAINVDLNMITANLFQYLLGSVILAVVSGICFGLVSYVILKISKSIRKCKASF